MKVIAVDIETKVTVLPNGKLDLSPYNPNNKLVSIGWSMIDMDTLTIGPVKYKCISHSSKAPDDLAEWYKDVDEAVAIVAHNAKFDLQWLLEANLLKLDNLAIRCTMVREYVLQRGFKSYGLNLKEVAERYGTIEKKKDLVQEYLDRDITFDNIPWDVIVEYGSSDVLACAGVFLEQHKRFTGSDAILDKTARMLCEFVEPLLEMERNGVKIDTAALAKVEAEYRAEFDSLQTSMLETCYEVMGDIPVKLSSPAHLSRVVYSVEVKDKEEWIRTFNIGTNERGKALPRPRMKPKDFRDTVKRLTHPVYKMKAHQCTDCKGTGYFFKVRKNGEQYSKPNICQTCKREGVVYTRTGETGGFQCKPLNTKWATSHGFSTSKTELNELLAWARAEGNTKAVEFLTKAVRLSAVEVYLSSFVEGIKHHRQIHDDILHVNFNQCITATGRLSSSNPNLQNQPRGGTFPVRRVFISRWAAAGGKLVDTDFSQLEFRCAGHLAQDPAVRSDVLGGLDIHAQTASTLTEAGQETDRQGAKSHTFKPLYGGMSGTPAEVTYYKKFLGEYYKGIGSWHQKLFDEAIRTMLITLPTGRQYSFPLVSRRMNGSVTQATQIVNYPVQGFATADIVPCAIIALYREMKRLGLKSKLILTVHDSVSIDCHPDEVGIVSQLGNNLAELAEKELTKRYKIAMFIPLACETKVGDNLLDMKKIS